MTQNKYFGTTGMNSMELGGNSPIKGLLTSAIASGKALGDDGKIYDTIQNAVDNSTGIVIIGPGTYNESITINTDGITILGSGYDTLLDSGANTAIKIKSPNITVKNLRITTDNDGSSYGVTATVSDSNNLSLDSLWIEETGKDGIFGYYDGSEYVSENWIITNCRISNTGGSGVQNVDQSIVESCIIKSAGKNGVQAWHDSIISNNIIISASERGISFGQNGYDNIAIGNRIIDAGDNGIEFFAADCIAANNRISGSSNNDIALAAKAIPPTTTLQALQTKWTNNDSE